jgi:hypothetical protein
MFERNGKYFFIIINNKIVSYGDEKQIKLWGGPLQYLPPDPKVLMKIDMSRNRIPREYKELLVVSKEELAEYENAKDDNELKLIVIKDCRNKQCKLIDEKHE